MTTGKSPAGFHPTTTTTGRPWPGRRCRWFPSIQNRPDVGMRCRWCQTTKGLRKRGRRCQWCLTTKIGPGRGTQCRSYRSATSPRNRPEFSVDHGLPKNHREPAKNHPTMRNRRLRAGVLGAPFADRSSPESVESCWRNDLRIARHDGHARVWAPRSKPSISMVRSATKLASWSRLGQPVMAIPPILPVPRDPKAKPQMQRTRLPCIELQNPFVTLISGYFSILTRTERIGQAKSDVGALRFIKL